MDFNSAASDGSCGIPNQVTRVVEGQNTYVNEYPWHVALVDIGEDNPW